MTDLKRSDDILIGKLVQAVDTLTDEVTTLRREMKGLTDQVNTGKGMFYGALFAAGGLGAGLSQLADKIFK